MLSHPPLPGTQEDLFGTAIFYTCKMQILTSFAMCLAAYGLSGQLFHHVPVNISQCPQVIFAVSQFEFHLFRCEFAATHNFSTPSPHVAVTAVGGKCKCVLIVCITISRDKDLMYNLCKCKFCSMFGAIQPVFVCVAGIDWRSTVKGDDMVYLKWIGMLFVSQFRWRIVWVCLERVRTQTSLSRASPYWDSTK